MIGTVFHDWHAILQIQYRIYIKHDRSKRVQGVQAINFVWISSTICTPLVARQTYLDEPLLRGRKRKHPSYRPVVPKSKEDKKKNFWAKRVS